MIIDLIADFLEDLFPELGSRRMGNKKTYRVWWEPKHPLAPKKTGRMVKADTREKAVDKFYKKVLPWRDRKLFALAESPYGIYVWLDGGTALIGIIHAEKI